MPKYTKETAREIAWERGVLDYLLHAGQDKIEAAYKAITNKLFVANCSRRLGKTYWACKKAVEVALTCPLSNPRIKYASALKKDLKEFVIPSFDMIFEDCPPEDRPTYKASEEKYVFPNGAEIQLVGLDKRPDGGRGNYCDLYIFEEAGMIKNLKYLYYSVVSPMIITRPGAKIIFISTPSVTPAHPFQTFCELAESKGAYIELNIYENPLLTEDQIEEIKRECMEEGGESVWLREYMCQHVIDENLAVVPEWRQRFERAAHRPEYYEYLHKYVGMDLGTKVDLTAILYGYFDPKKQRLVIEYEDEMNGPKMTTPALVEMIRKREADIWPGEHPYRRIADNDNPLLIQDLGILHKMHFTATSKDNLHAMINEVRILVREGRLVVHPRCKKLIGCLRYGIFKDEKRKTFDKSDVYGHYDHLAALIYLVRNLDKYTDPVPELWNVDRKKRLVLREPDDRTDNVKKIEKMFDFDD